jgi:hypothetical protein
MGHVRAKAFFCNAVDYVGWLKWLTWMGNALGT